MIGSTKIFQTMTTEDSFAKERYILGKSIKSQITTLRVALETDCIFVSSNIDMQR